MDQPLLMHQGQAVSVGTSEDEVKTVFGYKILFYVWSAGVISSGGEWTSVEYCIHKYMYYLKHHIPKTIHNQI